jgi:hypothetical protein
MSPGERISEILFNNSLQDTFDDIEYNMLKAQTYDDLNARQKRCLREQYVEDQKGICPVCEWPLDGEPRADILELPLNMSAFPPGFLSHPIHLQHNHDTGLTEAAVHAYCNGVLWQYRGQ